MSQSTPPGPVALIAQATEQFPHRPSWDEYFMATAKLIASRSNCERLNVGCVIVTAGAHRNRIVAAGYNGFLPGAPHDSKLRDGHEQATVHAEQNAIADAARRGSSVEGCVAYVTHFPCVNCAKILAASGIAEVRYRDDYHNDPLVAQLLAGSNVRITQLRDEGGTSSARSEAVRATRDEALASLLDNGGQGSGRERERLGERERAGRVQEPIPANSNETRVVPEAAAGGKIAGRPSTNAATTATRSLI